jgi:GH24 family phage-related lysozyme (muramidase)
MNRVLIEQLLVKHEGRRNKVYPDSRGILTIGIGFNLEDGDARDICDHYGLDLAALKSGTATLTDQQIDEIFDYQLTEAISESMSILPNFNQMPDTVQAVVVDMTFNLGLTRFSKFVSTIGQLKQGNYKQAAIDAKASLWAQQVPHRAADDIALLNAA